MHFPIARIVLVVATEGTEYNELGALQVSVATRPARRLI